MAKKKSVVATASGLITKMPMAKAGASIIRKKHHVLMFVRIINLDKCMETNLRDYYPRSVYKHPEPMEMMVPTPKDFGQYLQNKRNRRKKK